MVSENKVAPIYVCDCVDADGRKKEPVYLRDWDTGDRFWLCAACGKKPEFRGWAPWPEEKPPLAP